ncbi:unnamed protein product [Gadus morhua 'NCC']
MHLSKQGMESSDLDSDDGSEDGHDGGGITQNLDQESSDNRSEDAHDIDDITQKLDQESSDLDSDNGSEDGHDGGGITQNLDQESSDNRSEDAHDSDDITLSSCIFAWDQKDVQRLKEAKRAEWKSSHSGHTPTEEQLMATISPGKLKRHCRRSGPHHTQPAPFHAPFHAHP